MRKTALVVALSLSMLFAVAMVAGAATPQDQWNTSKHNAKNIGEITKDSPIMRDNCIACHDGQGFANNVAKKADLSGNFKTTPNSIECGTCHGAKGKGLMTSGATGKLANGLEVKGAGAGALCISCHNGRKTPDVAKKPAPHRSPQSDVLYASVGAKVPGVAYPSSPHGANPDSCVSCHMAKLDGIQNHTFQVVDKPEYVAQACGSCHPGLTTINRRRILNTKRI